MWHSKGRDAERVGDIEKGYEAIPPTNQCSAPNACTKVSMDAKLKQMLFASASEGPGAWLISAITLNDAAKRLNPKDNPAGDNEMPLSAVYLMLIGLSFENLLKGMRALQGESVDLSGKLNPYFSKHTLQRYAADVDAGGFTMSSDERAFLAKLEPYVTWLGRYPLPKKPGQFVVVCISNVEYETAVKLWERLYDHMKDHGWIKKIGGSKLPMK